MACRRIFGSALLGGTLHARLQPAIVRLCDSGSSLRRRFLSGAHTTELVGVAMYGAGCSWLLFWCRFDGVVLRDVWRYGEPDVVLRKDIGRTLENTERDGSRLTLCQRRQSESLYSQHSPCSTMDCILLSLVPSEWCTRAHQARILKEATWVQQQRMPVGRTVCTASTTGGDDTW